jgi:hypothetical protein
MSTAAVLERGETVRRGTRMRKVDVCTAVIPISVAHGFWPVVKMSDGTYRKGPYAEIIGRWSDG